ncbi:MAG: glucose-6-phosphate isomerase [Alphaproteobacteria bacterium]|nr:glucose-6-phosphate isomerase [Alphaproteobacteria bacterium]
MTMKTPKSYPSWQALETHHMDMRDFSLREALTKEDRFKDFSLIMQDTLFDFSKHLVTPETIALLTDLAKESGVETMRKKMFSGEKINNTENRSVLHIACRAPKSETINVDGENVIPFVHQVLDQMEKFTNSVRSGIHTGYTGKSITDIVNIGIGGSDLGPRYVVDALQDFCSGAKAHFVSNVDGQDISKTLEPLSPETTLFIIASKTFTTEETMMNAGVAKQWLLQTAPKSSVAQHFVAVSTNAAAVETFGIQKDNMFQFREWVGGRYSLWSAIGLSIALAIGFENFKALLNGARAMDEHFLNTPLNKNIPVLMGVLGIWYRNFYNYPAHMILPYDNRLGKIAKFTQQMDMESNGKAIDRNGHHVDYATGPIIFGEPGTDSQHSFMQWVHQSPTPVPADFILCKKPAHQLEQNHTSLTANFLAQTRALAIGQTLEEADGDSSRIFTGNRPTTSIIMRELTPYALGSLIAAYEHKVFVQGVIWNLNSFDQPGVELGKILAKPIKTMLEARIIHDDMDISTKKLAKFYMME